jgi:hypothetical protein
MQLRNELTRRSVQKDRKEPKGHKQLFDDTFKIVDTETGQFFANVNWPSIPTHPQE